MDSKKNLVLLIPSLKRGGAERVVSRLSKILKDDFNLRIVLFDGSSIDYETECEITVFNEKAESNNILSKTLKSYKRIIKYKKFKKNNEIDITYSFGNTANIVNIFSGYSDYKISSVRGFGNLKLTDNTLKGFIYRNLTKYTLKKSDLIISVSEKIKYVLQERFNIDSKKVEVIYNGYNVDEIEMLSNQDISLEEESWIQGKFVYISMGTYRVEKGYENLLNSFAEVNKSNLNTGLIIIGKGSEKEKSKLENLIQKLGLNDQVLLTGFTNNPYKYLAKSNCFVLSSRTEGFPNAMVEAMACGLPVISTDCNTGPREILSEQNLLLQSKGYEKQEYGILIKPFDEVETTEENLYHLISAMKEIKDNTSLRSHYIQQSKLRTKKFSYDYWKKKHLEVLTDKNFLQEKTEGEMEGGA